MNHANITKFPYQNKLFIMEAIAAIASFVPIGQAIAALPKIAETLKTYLKAEKELAHLVEEVMYYSR